MSPIGNRLIDRLPRRDRARLVALGEAVPLVLSDVLCEPGTPTRHVYFPTEGFISLVAQVDASPGLEVGMVGSEGMVGAHMVLGVAVSPLHALVQGTGSALRIGAARFRTALARNPALRRELGSYVYVLLAQTASTAGCLHFHRIEPRLARWLLMSQDRARSAHFHVTHEFLSYMMGVRRVGITMAAGDLQRRGLITYHRGEMTVLDRGGLESMACSCYRAQQRVYAELLG